MTKFFLGPMSKNIVDAVIESNFDFCLLPSRRQVDFNTGYVNNWTTKIFFNYVNNRVKIQRDHGGPTQGQEKDDGIDSFLEDSKYFSLIHVDPWREHKVLEDGIEQTQNFIKFIHSKNKDIKFEIGTEESIRPYTHLDLQKMLEILQKNLSFEEFNAIEFVSVQSGVGLDLFSQTNTGVFNEQKLSDMIRVIKKYDKKSKEHNGDFLSNLDYTNRFKLGLDAINIAPELGQIETECYVNFFIENDPDKLDKLYQICLDSKKWEKWVLNHSDVGNREKIIKVCGHYNFSNQKFLEIKPDIDDIIKKKLKEKLLSLETCVRTL